VVVSGLSDEEFQHWHEHGYVIIPLLDEQELKAAVDEIHEYMPPWEEYVRHRRWYDGTVARKEGHIYTAYTFPYVGDALNHSTIHPTLLDFATRALRTDRFMLSHGQLGGKYAGTRDFDQDLHCDYGNNMLVVPKPDAETFDVPAIVYYSDVTVDLSPTYVVDQQHTRDDPIHPRHRPRDKYPELYELEFPVTVPAGHALLYSMRTFHRGSALRASEGVRFAQNIGFRRGDVTWAGQETFQHEGGRPEMDHFLEQATPRQRELAGFPPIGDPYWDRDSIAAVSRRYPGMDMTPYEG
jgi:hypothetical protein